MNIAWITHHLSDDQPLGEGWIPGPYRGGAEMSDAEYLAHTPDGCHVQVFDSTLFDPDQIVEFDRIVVTGTDLLSEAAMGWLATLKPMVFVHHRQTASEGRRRLLEAAQPFVCHTPAHLALEATWANLGATRLVLSALDTTGMEPGEKKPYVLVASRNHPLKGINQSRLWAARHNLDCVVATDWPRSQVLATMRQAEWFVHLPLSFESECRTVMEAVLAGCTVVTNDQVGITSYPEWRDAAWLRAEIATAGDAFWRAVCEF